jgi:hypothetical protein
VERSMGVERRESARRTAVTRAVVDQIIHKSEIVVTIERLQQYLDIPGEAARRIIGSLINAGVVTEVRDGVWVKVAAFR